MQTQVIPYLAGLAAAGYDVVLLTFEPNSMGESARRSLRKPLERIGIRWHSLRYHKRPALPATLLDIVSGVIYGARLIRTRQISVVHARSHVPAVMALVLRWLLGVLFVFDIRGLLAEEYVDAGLWSSRGALYRLVKRIEGLLLAHADAAVVLTHRAKRWLFDLREHCQNDRLPVEVIPCCVDLKRFQVDPNRVRQLRGQLSLGGRPVMVYAGKFGGWYMAEELVAFFCSARRHFPNLRFLVLTQSDFTGITKEFARRNVEADAYVCLTVPPDNVPEYLALADFAVCFIKPCLSKIASSPTKVAEYLAAGLPVVFNAGIGDLDELEADGVGISISAFSELAYQTAAKRLRVLLDDQQVAAARCHAFARERFSLAAIGIPRYLRLYASLDGRVPSHA